MPNDKETVEETVEQKEEDRLRDFRFGFETLIEAYGVSSELLGRLETIEDSGIAYMEYEVNRMKVVVQGLRESVFEKINSITEIEVDV